MVAISHIIYLLGRDCVIVGYDTVTRTIQTLITIMPIVDRHMPVLVRKDAHTLIIVR